MTTSRRIYLSPPETTPRDRALLLEAFDSNWIAPLGPQVDAFEREFAEAVGVEHAVAVSSGTAALHLALIASGVQPGDHVITPTFTFVATANAIRHAGATPVFVDSLASTWAIDPEQVEEAIANVRGRGDRVTAVLPVDLFGQCADYAALRDICERHGLALIADAAESLGSTSHGRASAALADIGCYSFNGNKIITTSGGGMIATEDRQAADLMRHLASQARSPGVEYHHTEVAYNYRMSNLLAALGRGQLADLQRRVERRREVFNIYERELSSLPGVTFMPEADGCRSNRWLSCALVDAAQAGCTAEDLCLTLEAENIESRPLWKPLHRQPAHADAPLHRGAAPVADSLWQSGLCLPSGSSLTHEDQRRVIDLIGRALGGLNRNAA